MKPVIDQLLQEATILRVKTERPGSPLGRAQKQVTAAKREKSDVGQEAEKLGAFSYTNRKLPTNYSATIPGAA